MLFPCNKFLLKRSSYFLFKEKKKKTFFPLKGRSVCVCVCFLYKMLSWLQYCNNLQIKPACKALSPVCSLNCFHNSLPKITWTSTHSLPHHLSLRKTFTDLQLASEGLLTSLGVKLLLTLCVPIDCSPPGSSVHGNLQAIILESGAMPSSRGSSPPRDLTRVSCVYWIGKRILYH